MDKLFITPCLDIRDGRVVKGVQFTDLRDIGDPISIAKAYEKEGADILTILDISATTEGRSASISIIEEIAKAIDIPLIVGGGISSIEKARDVLKAGADKVSVSSAAVENPDLLKDLSEEFGKEKIILAIDGKKVGENYTVVTKGGTYDTGLELESWAVKNASYVSAILLSILNQDGAQSGYDLKATKMVAEKVDIPVIASGGAGKLEDFYNGVIIGKARGLLAASVFHDGVIKISEVKKYLKEKGL